MVWLFSPFGQSSSGKATRPGRYSRPYFLVTTLVVFGLTQALAADGSAADEPPIEVLATGDLATATDGLDRGAGPVDATWSFIGFDIRGPMTVELKPNVGACPEAKPRQLTVSVPGTVKPERAAEATAGCPAWTLTCSGDAYCSASIATEPLLKPRSASVPSAEGSTASNLLMVSVYPAAAVHGRIAVARGVALPRQVTVSGSVRPESVRPGRDRVPGDPDLEFVATVILDKDGKITFKAPIGTLDVRIAAENLAPAYRWNMRPTGTAVDLGRLEMTTGASLFGYVVSADTHLPVPGVTITAIPAGLEHAPITDQEASQRTRSSSARSQERGFFQLTALTPGAYRLRAEHPRYLTVEPPEVQVVSDAETVLRGDIVLSTPLELRVEIDPPISPGGHRWAVELERRLSSEQLETASADATGVATFEHLAPAEVTVRINAEDVRRAFETELGLMEDHDLTITLPVVQVLGHITLNEEPVQGTVFIARGDGDSWRVELDENGRFTTWIQVPKIESLLFLRIEGEGFGSPALIPFKEAAVEDGKIEIEINLLDLRVSGTVTSRGGAPVAGASVWITQQHHQITHAYSKKDGSFALGPLQAGSYEVKATQRGVGDSQLEPIELTEQVPESEVRLVIQPSRWLEGMVVGPSGESVAGAQIVAWSVGQVYVSADANTDINGRFKVRVAPESQQVMLAVLPQGYPYWSACLPSDRNLQVQLPAAGGWLDTAIDHGDDELAMRLGPHALLVNELGGMMPGPTSVRWAFQTGGGDAIDEAGQPVFRVPNLSPGRWGMVWQVTHLKDAIPQACSGALTLAGDWDDVAPGERAQLTLSLGND